jgi:3-dehydroquinate dehydratase I
METYPHKNGLLPDDEVKAPPTMVQVVEVAARDKPSLLVIFESGEEDIIKIIADVLGQPWSLVTAPAEVASVTDDAVVGILRAHICDNLRQAAPSRTILNAHCVDGGRQLDEKLAAEADFEYLYSSTPFFRRDLARFLSITLGQISHHEDLAQKERTTLISTTFPDVHAALPNLDILSVGADAVELRVDLLEEPRPDGSKSPVPSLTYVGEQLMLLRQRSELPIIYTTRCTNENGRFPMEDPELFYTYLSRAIQWGCEYIDVECWLPDDIIQRIARNKGHSKIISAFHDFSGNFKWTSPQAEELYLKGASFGDVVKMIALVNTRQENFELEYFRSIIQARYGHPLFSGLNMGPMGQLSRTLNKVFTPITHPLLPMIAAPGQLSAAEINSALHTMGSMPGLDIYGIGNYRSTTQAMFFEKCFRELSLPHQFMFIERSLKGSVESILKRPNFGGAYINPPIHATAPYLPSLTEPAQTIGQVDTVLVSFEGEERAFVGANSTWKGIRATLCREFVPSAYGGRAALILANAELDAAAAIYALKNLGIGPIYTIGFKAKGVLAAQVDPVRSLEDVKRLEEPFVIISALPSEKSLVVGPLLKHYSADGRKPGKSPGKVFVDLSNGSRKGDVLSTAASLGWTVYGNADVSAWTTVETMRALMGQNVPYDFVRLNSGGGFY